LHDELFWEEQEVAELAHDLREERLSKWTKLPFKHLSVTPHVWRLPRMRGFLIGYSKAMEPPTTMRDIYYEASEAALDAIAMVTVLAERDLRRTCVR
jgi:hypothetical protein